VTGCGNGRKSQFDSLAISLTRMSGLTSDAIAPLAGKRASLAPVAASNTSVPRPSQTRRAPPPIDQRGAKWLSEVM